MPPFSIDPIHRDLIRSEQRIVFNQRPSHTRAHFGSLHNVADIRRLIFTATNYFEFHRTQPSFSLSARIGARLAIACI
jgi:hypothetical protein